MSINEALITHCSPTLAGIKTGNLFSLNTNGADITAEICVLNKMLVKKGMRLIPLRKSRRNTLIYLYRPDRLGEDLKLPEAADILSKKGYPCGNPDQCVVALIRHLVSDEIFPHEIGLFLGYPPSDVKGFINSPNEGVQCVGYWKVYGNQKRAERIFTNYKKCTDAYCRMAEQGISLEKLAVDSRCIKNRRIVMKGNRKGVNQYE